MPRSLDLSGSRDLDVKVRQRVIIAKGASLIVSDRATYRPRVGMASKERD